MVSLPLYPPHYLSYTIPHPLQVLADQVVRRLGANAQPHHPQVPDESVLRDHQFHIAELVLHDSPAIFNWQQVGTVVWLHNFLPEGRKTALAPPLSSSSTVS